MDRRRCGSLSHAFPPGAPLYSRQKPRPVIAEEVAQEIYSLPELRQPNAQWYWAIYSAYYDKKVPELMRTVAFKGNQPMADLFSTHRVGTIVHISAIVRNVFAYAEQTH